MGQEHCLPRRLSLTSAPHSSRLISAFISRELLPTALAAPPPIPFRLGATQPDRPHWRLGITRLVPPTHRVASAIRGGQFVLQPDPASGLLPVR